MLNQRHSKKNLLVFLSILMGAQSCINQDDFEFDRLAGVKGNPSVALPLLYGSLTIDDLVHPEESGYILEDQHGLVHLIYRDTLRSTSIHDHFLLPQLNLNESYPAILGQLLSNGHQVVAEEREILDLDFPDSDFEEIFLKEGKVKVEAGSSLNSPVQLHISFPTLEKDGSPLGMKVNLPAGSNKSKVKSEAELAGYVADFSDYGVGENFIPVDVRAEIDGKQEYVIRPSDQVSLALEINGLKFNLLIGEFGQIEVELATNKIPLTSFEKIFSKGKFGLKKPMLNFEVLNSNGVPLELTAQVLQAINSKDEKVDIHIHPSSPFQVSYPTQFGSAEKTVITINNVGEIIEIAPSHIEYKLSGRLNTIQPLNLNFLTDNSALSVILNADIPLWGYLEGISLSDTLEMAFEVQDALVKEASLRVLMENEFPFEAHVQIDFVNERFQVIERLFAADYEPLLPASTVNSQGELASAGKYSNDIEISSERFERILKADKMIVKAILKTSQNQDGSYPHVKIKSEYKLNVNLGAKSTSSITAKL